MFQTEVKSDLSSGLAIVYQVQVYDVNLDELITSRRWATQEGAKEMGGKIIEHTKTMIDSKDLVRGTGWTEKDYVPKLK